MTDIAAFTPGDWVALVSVGLAAIAWGSTEFRRWLHDGAMRATFEATMRAEMEGFKSAILALGEQLKQTNEKYTAHEVECARFRGEVQQILKSNAETNAATGRALENLAAQMSRLMPPADTFTEVVSSTRRRGSGSEG